MDMAYVNLPQDTPYDRNQLANAESNLPLSGMDRVVSQFQSTWNTGAFSQGVEAQDLENLKRGVNIGRGGSMLMSAPGFPDLTGRGKEYDAENSPTLSKEDAQAKYGVPGLVNFDGPINEAAAKYQRDIAVRDYRQQAALQEGSPGGAIQSTEDFGVKTAGFLADPLNLAASLVPVVGEGRMALLAKGIFSSEKAAGIASGVLRSAGAGAQVASVDEAAQLVKAHQFDEDFSTQEALQNIMLNGAFGAGMHGAGELVGALWKGIRPQTKVEMLHSGIAQDLSGKPINVEPVINLDPASVQEDIVANKGQAITPLQRAENSFENSRVKNEDGSLKTVYHGTGAKDFDNFDPEKADTLGFHFGSAEQAEGRLKDLGRENTPRSRIIPVNLNLKNPLRLDDVGERGNEDLVKQEMINKGVDFKEGETPKEALSRAGYDGVVYHNTSETGQPADSYIATNPSQIKSSITGRVMGVSPQEENQLTQSRIADLKQEVTSPKKQPPSTLPKASSSPISPEASLEEHIQRFSKDFENLKKDMPEESESIDADKQEAIAKSQFRQAAYQVGINCLLSVTEE